MVGPPTPPPSSATELQDEARGNILNVEQTAPVATASSQASRSAQALPPVPPQSQSRNQPQDIYQHVFPTISGLASQRNYQDLVRFAEQADLNAENDRQQSRFLVTAPLVVAYLILDELPPARFALTRLPENIAGLPLPRALFGLLSSTWERKHARVYSRAEDISSMLQQTDFVDAKLAVVLSGLLTTFIEAFRHRTFLLISKAYTSISIAQAQSYLGIPINELLTAAEKNDWAYDASSGVLRPKAATVSLTQLSYLDPSSLGTFNLVADSVAKLEI